VLTVLRMSMLAAAVAIAYAVLCWIRRDLNARRMARWARATHPAAWGRLHWLTRRNPWAGVHVLITTGEISGPEIDAFRARDDRLEAATWLGLLAAAVLLLAGIAWQQLAVLFG
jgi:hypothetical protein